MPPNGEMTFERKTNALIKNLYSFLAPFVYFSQYIDF